MKSNSAAKTESGESFDLGQYKRAADLAYRYVKNKAEEDSSAEDLTALDKEDKNQQ